MTAAEQTAQRSRVRYGEAGVNGINKRIPTAAGTVGILNVGDGDTKLSFDPKNPAERIRAARIVKDMIRRGYALLIEHPPGSGSYTRALDFKEEVCEYVIADFDPITAAEADAEEEEHGNDQSGQAQSPATPGTGAQDAPRQRGRVRTVAAGRASAVAVAPIAGG
jgi:hypothetical protein